MTVEVARIARPVGPWVAGGFLIGAAATLLLSSAQNSEALNQLSRSGGIQSLTAESPEPEGTEPQNADYREAGVFADRLALYIDAAQLDDREVLISRVQESLRKPLSYVMLGELDALFGRLFEIAPRDAVGLLESADLPDRAYASICRLWARIDTPGAISLLSQVSEPRRRRLLALAIVDFAGTQTIDDIIAESGTLDADGLAMAAIVKRAEMDPLSALPAIGDLASWEAQVFAIREIGRIAAEFDPSAGILAAEMIADQVLKEAYVEELYKQWARGDLPQFIQHLSTLNPTQQQVSTLLQRALAQASGSDATLVLKFAQEGSGPLRTAAEIAGLRALSTYDPESAIEYLGSVPIGERRDLLAEATARGYARHDPNAALSWVAGLRPPSNLAEQAVMTGIAAIDLERAVSIELLNPDNVRGAEVGTAIPTWFESRMISDLRSPREIADQIFASDEGGLWEERMLTTALSRWSIADSDGAIAWMRSHPGNVPVQALETVAGLLAADDVEQMIDLGDMLAPTDRPDWIGRVLQRAVVIDPSWAMAIADRYRTEQYYDRLVMNIVGAAMSRNGPEAAAELLDTSPPPTAASLISQQWAGIDPEKAANWALGLTDQQTQRVAITNVLVTWAENDIDAATIWVQRVPDRTLREQILARICQSASRGAGCD